MHRRFLILTLAVLAAGAVLLPTLFTASPAHGEPGARGEGRLVVYCGRSKSLVEPLLQRFTEETGIVVEARYADTADLATLLMQEGARSPADVFFAQDPGALGAVEEAGLLSTLSDTHLHRVALPHRSKSGAWVGTSGRARVLAYSTDRLTESDLPRTVFELTDPKWRGRIGWAPTNASFQLFVTAMRVTYGDEATKNWLIAMRRNGARDYSSNRPIIQAIADGRIDIGLTNHYYLAAFKNDRGEDFPVANHYPQGDLGGLLTVAGVGVIAHSANKPQAERFVAFMLSKNAQSYFAERTSEFPLAIDADCPMNIGQFGPAGAIDLGTLGDLRGTLTILRDSGVLP
ncbi:MAG: iron ABC transporter substrate-binding protein [Phycisphaerales bacterium]|nr:MAG: iron ABC transporter substrate-binding protein [Phycisphaerales bacterium]